MYGYKSGISTLTGARDESMPETITATVVFFFPFRNHEATDADQGQTNAATQEETAATLFMV